MARLTWVFVLLFMAVAGLHLSGCSSGDLKESGSPEAAFKAAEEFDKDERWEEATTKYSEVKNKYPYSKYATEAELRIADIDYKKEAYIEAQTAYQLFKDFHPKHSRIDYVTYRLAMSYLNELPPTIDRDLSSAKKAIQYFDEVANSYSTSEYATDSREKKKKCLQMLADKEAYIANFYFIRDKYDSALRRYNNLAVKYPNLGHDEEALYRAAYSAFEIGDDVQGREKAALLKTKFPNSSYVSDANRLLEAHANR